MTVKELMETGRFGVVNEGAHPDAPIGGLFCCDLLSVAMSKAPAGAAWVTVMGNMNTLAVASLTEVACVILAEGAALDAQAREKAGEQGIPVLSTEEPIFDAALWVHTAIQ
ncbi:MAG: hypothetical protein LBR77_01260 [Lachnospiraceae bacterium]|jgi:hypothetical protein|nr:hypothetical protein [Lachnospiraceae bacterium]